MSKIRYNRRRPVSYTHLDVYKRQKLDDMIAGETINISPQDPFKDTPELDVTSATSGTISKMVSDDISSMMDSSLLPTGEYKLDRNKPETYLNSDDIEKVTQSDIFPQKRLFSFLHSKKIPEVPSSDDERKEYPLFHANILSQLFIWWVIPIIKTGYKRTVQPNDLFKMDKRMSIETLHDAFQKNMDYYFKKAEQKYLKSHPNATNEELAKHMKLPKWTVLKAIVFTFKRQLFVATVFAILANCTSGFNPMITKRLIEFVEKKTFFHDMTVNAGIGYAIGACIMMFLNGVFFNHFFHLSQLTGVQAKSVLTKAALNKMFRASNYAKHQFPNGKVTSFVTTDLSRLEFAISFQPFLFGFPAVFAICIVLLIVNLGAISLVGIGVFFSAFFACLFIFKQILGLRVVANKFTDARVTLMREILNNMKMVKYYAWEDAYEKNIQDVRGKEINTVRKMLFIRNFVIAMATALPSVASLVTFLCMYKVNNMGRTPGNVFSSLSLFQVLSIQMFFLPIAISTGIDMVIGLGRLQSLLESPEDDPDLQLERLPAPDLNPNVALKMEDGAFEWENYELLDAQEKAEAEEKLKKEIEDYNQKWYHFKKKTMPNPEELAKESTNAIDKTAELKLKKDLMEDKDAIEKIPFNGFHDLNFEIKKGEFIIMVGPIGTGKTSLLNAFAGFMNKVSGRIQINGDLLLCGYPWIQNASVKDNIIFGSPYNKAKYDEVIRVCSLKSDLDILPAGDLTEIGERGITLSGGQKARINLARSVYKQKDIYLFDDVLSAVDSRVGKHIMDECFLGLLKDKTRILATHQLSLLERASRVIVLGNDGSFDIGTVEELKQRSSTLVNLLQFSSQTAEKEEDEENENQEEEMEKLEKQMTEISKVLSRKEAVDGHTTMKEERAVNSISLKIYKEYLKAGVGKWGIVVVPCYLILIMCTTFCSLFSSVWLSYWTEDKFKNRAPSFYMGLYSFFVFFSYILTTSQFTLLCCIGVLSSKWLNLRAVKRILHTPMSYLDTTPLGRILNRFTKDTDSLDNELTESVRMLLYQFANIVGVCIMCIIYLPWFAIAIPFLFVGFVLIADHYQSSGREIKRLEAIQRSFVYNNFNEVLGGMDTIKSYRSENRFIAKSDFLIDKMNEAGYLVVAVQRWVAIFLDVIAVCFALIITLLCVTRAFPISAASVGVLLTYVLQLPGLLNGVLRSLTQTENDMNSAERLVTYATELPLEADYRKPEVSPPEEWPTKGEIHFENVDFSYRPGLPTVLKNLSLDIKSGEKIGICGRTGAGKSTIMSALYLSLIHI